MSIKWSPWIKCDYINQNDELTFSKNVLILSIAWLRNAFSSLNFEACSFSNFNSVFAFVLYSWSSLEAGFAYWSIVDLSSWSYCMVLLAKRSSVLLSMFTFSRSFTLSMRCFLILESDWCIADISSFSLIRSSNLYFRFSTVLTRKSFNISNSLASL